MTPTEVDSVIVQLRLKLPVDRAMVLEAYKAQFQHYKAEVERAGRFDDDALTQFMNDQEVLRHGLGI